MSMMMKSDSDSFELMKISFVRFIPKNGFNCSLLLAAFLAGSLHAEDETLVSRGPDKEWISMPTRTLENLPSIATNKKLGKYGGRVTSSPKATGFYHTVRLKDRWWLVDPEGLPYLHCGVASIRETRTPKAAAALVKKFENKKGWAHATGDLLKEYGFNSIGPWSDHRSLQPAKQELAYTKIWNFMSSYGKERGGTFQKSGHKGYLGNCPFIFDPEFKVFCEKHAQDNLTKLKDDPWLLGHFTDNELPWHIEMLDRYLALSKDEPGYQAAAKWIMERKGTSELPTEWTYEDRLQFVKHAADTYFSIVCKAIRKVDPNHLILGSRFHGSALKLPTLFEAAGQHLDAISVNYYHRWTPETERIRQWSANAGKPILITEWYAKGVDSGMGNTSGAGWLVKTQEDRGRFYQNFTLGLLESEVCIGWHWFRYSDNDPEQKGVDPSNLDSNKGIVTAHYDAYNPLLERMKAINERTYGLISHFDKKSQTKE